MKFNWKKIGAVALKVTGSLVPQVQIVEDAVDALRAEGKPTEPKAEQVVDSVLRGLAETGNQIGKELRTPRVESAIRRLNDDVVELHNALAEAVADQ
jgi:hypothetical protein